MNDGGVVSETASDETTVTRCVALATLPAPSVAVQIMVVVPTEYGSESGLPSERASATVADESSLAVAVPGSTVAASAPIGAVAMTSAGAVTVGGVVSFDVAAFQRLRMVERTPVRRPA